MLNELDGLAKRSGHPDGHHRDKNISHVATVAHHAKQAVSFIETEFGDQNKQLQVQTSKGSILKTLTFRSEHSDCPVRRIGVNVCLWSGGNVGHCSSVCPVM